MIQVVAIDGPAASGKSSTAREVACRLGFRHVDSGELYRRVTAVALGLGPGASAEEIVAAADRLGLDLSPEGEGNRMGPGPDLAAQARSPEVTAAVSGIAALPGVRAWVGRKLRAAGELGPGVVMDGRDIGTVVFPDAPVKLFLVARPEVRALRRLLEQAGPGVEGGGEGRGGGRGERGRAARPGGPPAGDPADRGPRPGRRRPPDRAAPARSGRRSGGYLGPRLRAAGAGDPRPDRPLALADWAPAALAFPAWLIAAPAVPIHPYPRGQAARHPLKDLRSPCLKP